MWAGCVCKQTWPGGHEVSREVSLDARCSQDGRQPKGINPVYTEASRIHPEGRTTGTLELGKHTARHGLDTHAVGERDIGEADNGQTRNSKSGYTGQNRHTHATPGPGAVNDTADHRTPDFSKIRKVCEKDLYGEINIDLRPQAFVEHRKREWPGVVEHTLPGNITRIYDVVRGTGLPNAMAARNILPTKLNLGAWCNNLEDIGGRPQLWDFLRFGFPLGYVGPVSDTAGVDNHASANDYPEQVDKFIRGEKEKGGLMGPFSNPPFAPWCHESPLMSRPKADPTTRRVITDMTFPYEASVNAFVIKNGVFGIEMEHTLPTVEALVRDLKAMGQGAYLATLDIARAYKNFNSDPLDWPLLCFGWGGEHFYDTSIPFGARASSYHMQQVANAIVDMLKGKGVHALMYLDDIVILSPDRNTAIHDFAAARTLLRDLGLPEAEDKAQEPGTRARWLGIIIDTEEMTLSVPEDKLQQVLQQVQRYVRARTMSKKQLQSVLGHLLHVAKCVPPARIFVSRLLEALRNARGCYMNVNTQMRADFRWFLEFCSDWNGKSYIPSPVPARDIYVDACLSGIGATDGKVAYAGQVTFMMEPQISQN